MVMGLGCGWTYTLQWVLVLFRIERNGNSLFLRVLDKRREIACFLFIWYSWFSPCQEIVNTEVGWQGSAGKNGFRVTSRWGFRAGWEWVNSIALWCQTKAFSGPFLLSGELPTPSICTIPGFLEQGKLLKIPSSSLSWLPLPSSCPHC